MDISFCVVIMIRISLELALNKVRSWAARSSLLSLPKGGLKKTLELNRLSMSILAHLHVFYSYTIAKRKGKATFGGFEVCGFGLRKKRGCREWCR